MDHCHCTVCRKAHGASFATYVGAMGFRWVEGDGEQGSYASSADLCRAFCPTCGSKIPGAGAGLSEGQDRALTFLPAGLLDGDPGVRAESHIYAAFRAPWVELHDGLRVFEGAPPGYPDPGMATPARPEGASPGSIAGSCLCGAVAWEQTQVHERMGHCHCSRCRKVRGAAFSTQLFGDAEHFRWICGRELVEQFRLPGAAFYGNSFCRSCASPVAAEAPAPQLMMIPAGALDDDPGVRPSAHIYVGSKAPWVEITDDLFTFDEMPPAM